MDWTNYTSMMRKTIKARSKTPFYLLSSYQREVIKNRERSSEAEAGLSASSLLPSAQTSPNEEFVTAKLGTALA
jgi:hypothetical protein